jgi:glycerol uptake facilitator-like aquaporin
MESRAQQAKNLWNENSRPWTYELLGTAMVTFAFTASFFDPLIRALAYFIVYLIAQHISGAHFNPATTLAVCL